MGTPATFRRIYAICGVPARVRFLSVEPLLADLGDISGFLGDPGRINWVLVGGESGAHARPSHPDWYRATRDFCIENKIRYFHKQWGSFGPWEDHQKPIDSPGRRYVWASGKVLKLGDSNGGLDFRDSAIMERVPKRSAGRLLDGRTWDEVPR